MAMLIGIPQLGDPYLFSTLSPQSVYWPIYPIPLLNWSVLGRIGDDWIRLRSIRLYWDGLDWIGLG